LDVAGERFSSSITLKGRPRVWCGSFAVKGATRAIRLPQSGLSAFGQPVAGRPGKSRPRAAAASPRLSPSQLPSSGMAAQSCHRSQTQTRWGEPPGEPSPSFPQSTIRIQSVVLCSFLNQPFALAISNLRLQYRHPNEKQATGNNERKIRSILLLCRVTCMSGQFEPVHEVDDYYDGPRTGIAEYHGVRHRFRSVVWPPGKAWDSEDDRFELILEVGTGPVVIAHAAFRVRQPAPELPLGVLRPLEVTWRLENT
jgi:hypothetical protein